MRPTYYYSNDDGRTRRQGIHTNIHYISLCACANMFAIKHALHPRGRLSEIIVLLLLLYHSIRVRYAKVYCAHARAQSDLTIGPLG